MLALLRAHQLIALLLFLIFPLQITAQGFSNIYHRGWTTRDGVPDSMWGLTQTTDGFLWIASDTGLYRFDGIHFLRYSASVHKLVSDQVVSVYGASNGDLWVGYQFGGASRIRSGVVTDFPREGALRGTVLGFAETPDHTIWVGTASGLFRMEHDVPVAPTPAAQYHVAPAFQLRVDRDGTLWVGSDKHSMQCLMSGKETFEQLPEDFGFNSVFRDNQNFWWSSGSSVRYLDRSSDGKWTVAQSKLGNKVSAMAMDRNGDMWWGTEQDGLFITPSSFLSDPKKLTSASAASFTRADGLTRNSVQGLFADREGGMWVRTQKGLDYFRRSRFTNIPFPAAVPNAVMANLHDGSMLFGSSGGNDDAVYRFHGGELSVDPHLRGAVTTAYYDTPGSIWIGYDAKVVHWLNGQSTTFLLPPDSRGIKRDVQAIRYDHAGRLWVAANGEPPFLLEGSHWSQPPSLIEKRFTAPLSILAARDGSMWFGFPNRLMILSQGKVYRFDEQSGLHTGSVAAMFERGDHIWIVGSQGVQFVRGGRLHDLHLQATEDPSGASGVYETSKGALWINSRAGAITLAADQVTRLLQHPERPADYRILDALDNFPGAPTVIRPLPSLVADDNERLYFAARDSVAWIDPEQSEPESRPPGIKIDQMTVDGRLMDTTGIIKTIQKPSSISFAFSVGTLLFPERTKVRYKLEGFESGWHETETTREALYSQLPAGNFTFVVEAVNGQGIHSTTPAMVSFVVPPTFFQSIWFRGLCVVAGLLMVRLLYYARVRYLLEKAEQRHALQREERARIARDLHDTFFPSVHGIFLQVQATTRSITAPETARHSLEKLLDESDDVMEAGRRLIFELRSPIDEDNALEKRLTACGEELSREYGIAFNVLAEGQSISLQLTIAQEIFIILQEAMRNAFRHSNASAIHLVIAHDPAELRLELSDNGRGIPVDILHAGSADGHWGLPGMRERAAAINAKFTLQSETDSGTRISLEIPARIAYQR